MYVQGMSSSLPEDVQIAMYRTLPGLEDVRFMRTAYAIEYDCIDANQLKLLLNLKIFQVFLVLVSLMVQVVTKKQQHRVGCGH